MLHGSRSDEQQKAEPVILAALSARLCKRLDPARIEIGDGASVEPDGVDADRSVFVEVYARQGKLVGGQLKKVAQDILKFSILRRDFPDADLVLAFASIEAMDSIRGWLRVAAERHRIRFEHVPLPEDLVVGILAAQDRQREGMKQTAASAPEVVVGELDEGML